MNFLNLIPNDNLQKITSKELKLSFNFSVASYDYRILTIKLDGFANKISYSEKFFDWFVEDLIYFLDKNGYARRWDYQKIYIENIISLNLGKDEDNFVSKFKSVTNFDLIAK
ncbi:Uncharacterised protein [Mesomycoplasma conjunctivae]|uniref:Uncharacterized protein n=1 Tax=Mesomycoplasma conjunctivae (strain ATCC 25834 / NCTC 10147 / HRC/581) TaxID=572263 RepID=C5J6I2_MESCH|nr:hypothetical protein [Mesomycoplasma conjunctivae]CAT05074.1 HYPOTHETICAL PROTEIN MCJ_003860 [Mesomycoplasma conjunctivae]VEU66269.1 Uncharacterised protein [Mesomycoplasma conjunctivae]